jgi:predicted cupin superfamily sugar epimerase
LKGKEPVVITVREIISRLSLQPHPEEGGYFRETYRSKETVSGEALPHRFSGQRSLGTAIYYLLTPETFSSLHRLQSDEVFHFYLGDPVEMLQLHPDGSGRTVTLGGDLLNGMEPQILIPKGVWQGARLAQEGRFALMGTTVAPGFDYADYEQGDRSALIVAYPQFEKQIVALTG